MNIIGNLSIQPGLPPDRSEGVFLGLEANGQAHLIAWHRKFGCWASVSIDPKQPSERMWEANLIRDENEGRIVCWASIPTPTSGSFA